MKFETNCGLTTIIVILVFATSAIAWLYKNQETCDSSADCADGWMCNYNPGQSLCENCADLTTVHECDAAGFISYDGTKECYKNCLAIELTEEHYDEDHDHDHCESSADCAEGWMCNYDPGYSFCENCEHFTSKHECEETGFISYVGTKECFKTCLGNEHKDVKFTQEQYFTPLRGPVKFENVPNH